MKGLEKNEIRSGNIMKGMLKLAFPLMLLNVINSLYSIVDTFWVGRIGELYVGAVSLISPIMDCGSAFATGLSAAAMALIAISVGAGDNKRANSIATHLLKLCIVLGIGIGVVCVVFARPILDWLETPADIYNEAYRYLLGISLDFLFLFILNLFQAIRQSNGDSKSGVKINALASVINIILDPVLIFGCNLGVLGAALATMLSKMFVTPIAIYILLNEKESTCVNFSQYHLDFQVLEKIIIVAIPASIGSFLSSFGFVMMNKSIVAYGSIAISAYGIGNRISGLSYIPLNSLGGALTPYIGQNLGAKNEKRARESFWVAMKLAVVISIIITIIGFMTAKYCVLLFVNHASAELLAMACEYAYYSIGTAIFMGWFNNLSAVFNGSGHTKYSLFLSTFRLWGLRIPMIYAFGAYTSLGPTGIWWAMVLSNIVTCIIGQIMYFVLPWNTHQIKENLRNS